MGRLPSVHFFFEVQCRNSLLLSWAGLREGNDKGWPGEGRGGISTPPGRFGDPLFSHGLMSSIQDRYNPSGYRPSRLRCAGWTGRGPWSRLLSSLCFRILIEMEQNMVRCGTSSSS